MPTTPREYLSEVAPGYGQRAATCSSFIGRSHAAPAGRSVAEPSPMSTTSTSPQCVRAGSITWHGFASPKVTVRVAQNASPGTAPVSAATPDGRSTAIVGTSQSRQARASRATRSGSPGRPPIPTMPSITRSACGRC